VHDVRPTKGIDVLNRKPLLAASVAVLLGVAACGGSSGNDNASDGASSGASAGTGGPQSLKVGVFYDATGPAAASNKDFILGVKAGAEAVKKDGLTLEISEGDTTTSPQAAGAAAQKLVQKDKVDAVLAQSALAFAGAPFLAQQGVPVVGFPEDGPEWLTLKNMFSVIGPLDGTKVTTTIGEMFKKTGATTVGTLGYGVSPQSALATKATAVSAKEAGLKAPYVNTAFQFGGTNVQPVALGMKAAGVDGVTTATDQNTALALAQALKQVGAPAKTFLLAQGYGGDTINAGPDAVKAAEGAYFTTSFLPVESNTDATKRFVDAYTAVGVKQATYSIYNGYVSVLLLAKALKETSSSPSKADIIKALEGITSFDADGLRADHPVNPGLRTVNVGDEQCQYYSQLKAGQFKPVDGLTPLCGKVTDKTVKP
jgi:branched-chain amino acid transport system substrate-binding protein